MTLDEMISELDLYGFEDLEDDQKTLLLDEAYFDIVTREPWPFLENIIQFNKADGLARVNVVTDELTGDEITLENTLGAVLSFTDISNQWIVTPERTDVIEQNYKLDALDDMTVALNSIYQSLVLSRNGNGIGGTLINTPNIINLVLTAANTAYTHIFPSTARQISFTARAAAGETQNTIYYAYTQNQVQTLSGTHILTLKPGETKTITSLFLQEPLTIYFASPVAGTIVAIEWWIVAS